MGTWEELEGERWCNYNLIFKKSSFETAQKVPETWIDATQKTTREELSSC